MERAGLHPDIQEAEGRFEILKGVLSARMAEEDLVAIMVEIDPVVGRQLVFRRDGTWCTSSHLDTASDDFFTLDAVLERFAYLKDPTFRRMEMVHADQWKEAGEGEGVQLEERQEKEVRAYIRENHRRLFGELSSSMEQAGK